MIFQLLSKIQKLKKQILIGLIVLIKYILNLFKGVFKMIFVQETKFGSKKYFLKVNILSWPLLIFEGYFPSMHEWRAQLIIIFIQPPSSHLMIFRCDSISSTRPWLSVTHSLTGQNAKLKSYLESYLKSHLKSYLNKMNFYKVELYSVKVRNR